MERNLSHLSEFPEDLEDVTARLSLSLGFLEASGLESHPEFGDALGGIAATLKQAIACLRRAKEVLNEIAEGGTHGHTN